MKKAAALLILVLSAFLCTCSKNDIEPPQKDPPFEDEEIFVPTLEGCTREPASLSDIVYSRPDTASFEEEINTLTDEISTNSLAYEEIVEKIYSLAKKRTGFSTMLTYTMIKNSRDCSDEYFAEEYDFLKSEAPALTKAIEEMFVAAAHSEYAERLEAEVFWDGFVKEYSDGTVYNDLVVSILESEAELEVRYSTLSTATVKISYDGVTDTYDNVIDGLKKKYSEGSKKLKNAVADCERLYAEALMNESTEIYVELLKVRRRLADALGYNSYAEYAYDLLGHSYTDSELYQLLSDIAEYTVPAYSALSTKAFSGYFNTHKSPQVGKGKVANTIYSTFEKIDSGVAEAYAYMLNYNLYDFDYKKQNRLDGAFATYLYDISSPYLFATLEKSLSDYMTISHEFGHFYDYYINGNSDTSLDLMEVSSTGLELLVLASLGDKISEEEYKYLYYSEMKKTMEELIFQAFYAEFEAMAYALPYNEISIERLNALVTDAAEFMHLNTEYFTSVNDILIYHLIMEPFYVQSYCTSTVAALDIFFTETQSSGAGVDAYMLLLDRKGEKDFTAELSRAKIPSPFRKNGVKELSDKIYYSILGSYYFVDNSNQNNAA